MEKFSIQEIKLLSSFELCETKRAICRMILASFESYKRETPSCTVLISFSGASEAQLNSLGGNRWKGQNWLLSGRWLNSKFKHLRNLREAQRGASAVPARTSQGWAWATASSTCGKTPALSGFLVCRVCLWKADAFMLIRRGRLQPRMEVTLSETEYRHIQAHVAGADGHLLN